MPKVKIPKEVKDTTPVFTWAFKSSKAPLVGGAMFDYVAQLNQDGTVSCNCPGWRFVKKGQVRRCRHTDAVKGEAPELMASWRDGKTFETVEFTATTAVRSTPALPSDTTSTKKVPKQHSKIKFNRLIEL